MMKSLLARVEFWIIFFFVIRLFSITQPPLEAGHSWRQVTGLMVARNFLETDANIFFPRVDETNGATGIIGMEFPLLNYSHFLVAKVFGYTHWYGRLINLIIASIGLLYFYKLVKHFFAYQLAFISTLLLTVSIWFSFARKMMPDVFCISLMFIALYHALQYLERQKLTSLIWYVLFSTMALLSKIPAAIYLIVIPLFFLAINERKKEKINVLVVSIIPVSLMYWWYFIWNPVIAQQFGNWYNLGRPLFEGFCEIVNNLPSTFNNFYFNAFCSYTIFIFFIAGLGIATYKKEFKLVLFFVSVFFVFLIYVFKSGFFFYHHSYYIIPFVPVMAVVAAYALIQVKIKWIMVLLISTGIIESMANQQHDFFIKKSERYKMNLEIIADAISEKGDLVAINGNGNPQQLYFLHRKGWNCNNHQLADSCYITNLRQLNCKFIFVNKHTYYNRLNLLVCFENRDYFVYKF